MGANDGKAIVSQTSQICALDAADGRGAVPPRSWSYGNRSRTSNQKAFKNPLAGISDSKVCESGANQLPDSIMLGSHEILQRTSSACPVMNSLVLVPCFEGWRLRQESAKDEIHALEQYDAR